VTFSLLPPSPLFFLSPFQLIDLWTGAKVRNKAGDVSDSTELPGLIVAYELVDRGAPIQRDERAGV
jgi:hypothetical protein